MTQKPSSDELGPKPVIQLRKIEVPALPIPANRVSWERAIPGLPKHGFAMHVEVACSGLWADGRLTDRMW